MALRHFCKQGSLRGVSLLMWLGANPRAKVPDEAEDYEEFWETPLETAASKGQLDIIKRIKPDPAKDDIQSLLLGCLHRWSMDLVLYWVSLGADVNHVAAEGPSAHHRVMSNLSWELDFHNHWYARSEATQAKRFAVEWFSAGAKWTPQGDDFRVIRKASSRLSYMEAYEFIKLLREKDVMPPDSLGEILDTPKLREHLKERRAAIAALVPKMQKWVKAEQRKRQREKDRQTAARLAHKQTPPSRISPEPRVVWNDPRYVRRLSDD